MKNPIFDAIDECGNRYPFSERREGNSLFLTLPKESFKKAHRLRALGQFTKACAGDAGWYLQPRNIKMTGEFFTEFLPREDVTFSYKHPVLSLFGIKTADMCALVRIERNYKYYLETTVQDGVYSLAVLFDFDEYDTPYDDIRIEVVFLPTDAGYAEMARTERSLRLARGEITTLAEKCKREAVEYARRYPLIRIRLGWKPSPSPVAHQTPENEPPLHIACSFARVRDIADELVRQGVAGAELQLVGWNIGGHDGRYPQLFPVDPRLGGKEELLRTVEHVKSLGYRISFHTNVIDSYEIADCYSPAQCCITRTGEPLQSGHFSGGDSYHVCPTEQLKNNRRDLPDVAALGGNGIHFTDVLSIVEPDDCHSPVHPLPTAKGIAVTQQIMHETRERMGAFSSEGTMDFAIGELDFGLYVTFGNGFGSTDVPVADRTLPFFELLYHGILLYNPASPTVNYPIKAPQDRVHAYLRGGRPTFYFFSRFREDGHANWMGEDDLITTTDADLKAAVAAVKGALKDYTENGFDSLQTVFLKDYRILESQLEIATYENGTTVIGNPTDHFVLYQNSPIPAGALRVIRG